MPIIAGPIDERTTSLTSLTSLTSDYSVACPRARAAHEGGRSRRSVFSGASALPWLMPRESLVRSVTERPSAERTLLTGPPAPSLQTSQTSTFAPLQCPPAVGGPAADAYTIFNPLGHFFSLGSRVYGLGSSRPCLTTCLPTSCLHACLRYLPTLPAYLRYLPTLPACATWYLVPTVLTYLQYLHAYCNAE